MASAGSLSYILKIPIKNSILIFVYVYTVHDVVSSEVRRYQSWHMRINAERFGIRSMCALHAT